MKPSLQARGRYSVSDLLSYLNEDDVDLLSGELRCNGSFNNFLRVTSCDFESLISMIGHTTGKQDTTGKLFL